MRLTMIELLAPDFGRLVSKGIMWGKLERRGGYNSKLENSCLRYCRIV